MSLLACQYNLPKRPGDLDLLTLKVVSESHATWATSVPLLVFLGLSVLDLCSMYATDRRQTDRHGTLIIAYSRGWGIIMSGSVSIPFFHNTVFLSSLFAVKCRSRWSSGSMSDCSARGPGIKSRCGQLCLS